MKRFCAKQEVTDNGQYVTYYLTRDSRLTRDESNAHSWATKRAARAAIDRTEWSAMLEAHDNR